MIRPDGDIWIVFTKSWHLWSEGWVNIEKWLTVWYPLSFWYGSPENQRRKFWIVKNEKFLWHCVWSRFVVSHWKVSEIWARNSQLNSRQLKVWTSPNDSAIEKTCTHLTPSQAFEFHSCPFISLLSLSITCLFLLFTPFFPLWNLFKRKPTDRWWSSPWHSLSRWLASQRACLPASHGCSSWRFSSSSAPSLYSFSSSPSSFPFSLNHHICLFLLNFFLPSIMVNIDHLYPTLSRSSQYWTEPSQFCFFSPVLRQVRRSCFTNWNDKITYIRKDGKSMST